MGSFSFFTTAELQARGHSDAQIRAEVAGGALEPVIRGWYCRADADRAIVRAMRLGGRISCVSALALLGGWDPPDSGLHVGFPSHASGRRLARAEEAGGRRRALASEERVHRIRVRRDNARAGDR